jgi:hypothetical protein
MDQFHPFLESDPLKQPTSLKYTPILDEVPNRQPVVYSKQHNQAALTTKESTRKILFLRVFLSLAASLWAFLLRR